MTPKRDPREEPDEVHLEVTRLGNLDDGELEPDEEEVEEDESETP